MSSMPIKRLLRNYFMDLLQLSAIVPIVLMIPSLYLNLN